MTEDTYCRCGDPECPIHLVLSGQDPAWPVLPDPFRVSEVDL